MGTMKISQKDIKLIIILIAVLILGASYLFIYQKNIDKADACKKEIKSLKNTLSEYEGKKKRLESITEDKDKMLDEIDKIVGKYGPGDTAEKNIVFIENLEKEAQMSVNSIEFMDPEYFYNPAEDGGLSTSGLNNMKGYISKLSITFKTNYAGLKKGIDYINHYPDKRNVSDMVLSYDTETGNLTGTMTIKEYHLIGNGKEYVEPVIGGVEIGSDNIFGTIEIPNY